MVELRYNVQGQKITQNNKKHLVNQSRNYLKLRFTFTNDWKGLDKYIIFDGAYKFLLTDNMITVPNILLQGTEFVFSLYAVDEENITLITTENITVKLRESGYVQNASSISGDTPPDAIEDLYNTKLDNVELKDRQLMFYAKGKVIASISLQNIISAHTHSYRDITDLYSFIMSSDNDKVRKDETINLTATLRSFIGVEPNRTIYFYTLGED